MGGLHGLVLAGGISSRMGFPKALMPIGNSFFLLRIYEQLVSAGVSPVHMVINTGLRSSLEAQMSKFAAGKLVLNGEPALGQIHSLKLGLQSAASSGAAGVLVALVDQPGISPDTLREIREKSAAAPGKIIVPVCDGKNGHPIVIPAACFGAFVDAPKGKNARDVIEENADTVKHVEIRDSQILADVDSPEDLANMKPEGDMD
jgi:CTP:molybdopterin cytidylyltransferase MocA